MVTSFDGAAIRFQRRGSGLAGPRATYKVSSEDGAWALSADTVERATAGKTQFVDAYSGVPQFAVLAKRRVLNSKYDVLDSKGAAIGRLKHHVGDGQCFWTLMDAGGEAKATIVTPDTVLKQFLARTLDGTGDAYAFVRGNAPFATLTHEKRRAQGGSIAKLARALLAPRDWVLRLDAETVNDLDPRVVIAAALMLQELTVDGGADVANPHPNAGLTLTRLRTIARL